jgi:molybdenum cofactor biosynthesis protein MoaC
MKTAARMVDVGPKPATARRAAAVGSLKMSRRAFGLLRTGRLPKGDALAVAEVAGILAAKKTPELLPLCHPLFLDAVSVEWTCDESLPGARVRCVASTTAKTGVEMEALTGASAALLCLYDLVKPVDPALVIDGVRLEFKEGGKRGLWRHPDAAPAARATKAPRLGKAVAITVSDRVSAGRARDASGPLLAAGLRAMGFTVVTALVPDERAAIAAAIVTASKTAQAVVLTGGTGLSPRDVTPETVASLCSRLVPGVGEALRSSGGPATAALSRSLAGQRGNCIIVALPGSPGGVRDGLRVLADLLPHAAHVARGGGH